MSLAGIVSLISLSAYAIPRVVVPGTTQLYAASVDETMPLSDASPASGLVARSVGAGITGLPTAKIRNDLGINGVQWLTDPERGVMAAFNGAGRYGWELPTAVLAPQTQMIDGQPQPFSIGVSLMFRHHLSAAQRVNGWAPLVGFAKLNQPWAFALLLRNGVPVLAHKQKNGTFFDLGAQAVGHQPTLRVDDGKWHHLVLNFHSVKRLAQIPVSAPRLLEAGDRLAFRVLVHQPRNLHGDASDVDLAFDGADFAELSAELPVESLQGVGRA